MTTAEMTRGKWVEDFGLRSRASGSILDYTRLTEPTYEKLPLMCSPGYGYSPAGHKTWKMACKRRNCLDCGWYWACKWRNALKEKARYDSDFNVKPVNKALTLTFAEYVPYDVVQKILRQFWKLLRRAYPNTEYWGVVEFNQAHTIPHLHFLVQQNLYLELDYIDYCWRVAQSRYDLKKLAWNIRIEKIRKNTQAYFTKYITKLTGGKDEIPRREFWSGRFVRYSAHFFPISARTMIAGRVFNDKLKAGDNLDRVYWYVRRPLKYLKDFQKDCRDLQTTLSNAVNATWEPERDKSLAAVLPPDDLLTGIDTIPVFHVKQFDAELYGKIASYNFVTKTERCGPAF